MSGVARGVSVVPQRPARRVDSMIPPVRLGFMGFHHGFTRDVRESRHGRSAGSPPLPAAAPSIVRKPAPPGLKALPDRRAHRPALDRAAVDRRRAAGAVCLPARRRAPRSRRILGGEQTLVGPALAVPLHLCGRRARARCSMRAGRRCGTEEVRTIRAWAYFLPEELEVDGRLDRATPA